MKQIIDGKRYNTETASCIGEYSNGLSRSDFNYIWEGLYKTKKGTYFLAGEGGASTKYATSCGTNSWSGDSRIQVVSKDEAKYWAENHLTVEEIEAEFGSEIEDA